MFIIQCNMFFNQFYCCKWIYLWVKTNFILKSTWNISFKRNYRKKMIEESIQLSLMQKMVGRQSFVQYFPLQKIFHSEISPICNNNSSTCYKCDYMETFVCFIVTHRFSIFPNWRKTVKDNWYKFYEKNICICEYLRLNRIKITINYFLRNIDWRTCAWNVCMNDYVTGMSIAHYSTWLPWHTKVSEYKLQKIIERCILYSNEMLFSRIHCDRFVFRTFEGVDIIDCELMWWNSNSKKISS